MQLECKNNFTMNFAKEVSFSKWRIRYSLVAVLALKVRLKVSSDYQQQRRWRGGGRLSSGLLMVDRSGAGLRHRPVIADHWFLHLHQICDDRLQSINNTFKTCYILCDSWWILNNI